MAADTMQPGGNNQTRDEAALRLLRVLFHDVFCPQEDVPQEKKADIAPVFFYGWLDKHWTEFDQVAVCEKAKVEADTWHFVRQVLEGGTAVEACSALWFSIVLSDRPKPAVGVKSINVLCNITFDDGSISTTQGLAAQEMFGGAIDDAVAFTTLRMLMKNVITTAVAEGLAGLHAEAKKTAWTSQHPNDPFHVFMGWCIKHMIRGEPMPGKLDPVLVPAVENYMRLAQQCIRPVVPANVLAGFKARQQQEAGKEAGKPRGGWNV